VRFTSGNPIATLITLTRMVRQRLNAAQRPGKGRRWRLRLLVAALFCCSAYDCDAIDRVILHIGQLSTARVQAQNVNIALDVTPQENSASPTLQTRIGKLQLYTTYDDVEIQCTDLVIRQPQWACNRGSIAGRGGATGPITVNVAARYNASSGAVALSGSAPNVAGAATRFNGKFQGGTWSLNVAGDGLDLALARQRALPWIQLPADDILSGHLKFRLESTGELTADHRLGRTRVYLAASTSDLNFSSQPGTTVAQNVTVAFSGSGTSDRGRVAADFRLQSSAGQALAGAVLLDFGRNPLTVETHVEPDGRDLSFTQVHVDQTDLIDARGSARIALGGPITLAQAHFDVRRLDCAAAYRSFLQLTLATTDFGALNVGGQASGGIDLADDALSQVTAHLQNVSMADATTRLSLANANGELHWAATSAGPVEPSQLAWSGSSAYGLIGGPVAMKFTVQGKDFALAGETRLPIFDGALRIHTLAIRRFGPDAELDFDATLEPISMPLLSKAFGWPVLSGQLAGTIPGVTYRHHVLTVQCDLSAHVFDGTLVGSRFKLSDPLGPWPRLAADVRARHLDLDLLTHTFSIGSITGRLDADLAGLELFNWSPVAFDARLQSTPGDTSEHRISQKAVTSLSSVGGGGGSVSAALQSGVLRFFKTFHYDRIGISCQLRDEVCLMSGLEPARAGYYLVKGRGLPRIDIIGNAGRVDWTQLVAQISASMHSQNIVIR
jgi:hypothetical protein